jgi:hypothetical protein
MFALHFVSNLPNFSALFQMLSLQVDQEMLPWKIGCKNGQFFFYGKRKINKKNGQFKAHNFVQKQYIIRASLCGVRIENMRLTRLTKWRVLAWLGKIG